MLALLGLHCRSSLLHEVTSSLTPSHAFPEALGGGLLQSLRRRSCCGPHLV